MRTGKVNVGNMVRVALLIAIIIILTVTPLGYLTLGPISATIIQIPVVIGAAMMGPGVGMLLGAAFGLSSFIKVLTVPGADIVATTILTQNVFLYFSIAFFPRLFMGLLSGLLHKALSKIDKTRLISYAVTGFVGSMLNTIFYLGSLLFFAQDVLARIYEIDISAVSGMVMTVAVSFGIPEAVVCCVIVTALAKPLEILNNKVGYAA